MDEDRLETSYEFDQQERHTTLERKAVGVGDRYYNMNPTSAPAIDKGLIGNRLDVCLQYFLDDGITEIFWSQGEVIFLSDGTNIPNKKG